MTVGKLSEMEYCRIFFLKIHLEKEKKEIESSKRLMGLRLLTTESVQPFSIKLQTEEWLI